jgi:hypothetical protein
LSHRGKGWGEKLYDYDTVEWNWENWEEMVIGMHIFHEDLKIEVKRERSPCKGKFHPKDLFYD